MEGNQITRLANSVNLSLVLPSGATLPLTPASVTFVADGWNNSWGGLITLPSGAEIVPPLRLRATDAAGNTGDSNPFDMKRVLNLMTTDMVWDATRARIYASVPATGTGTYANKVVAIDPLTLQITGSVATGQDPGRLELTSGGEFLYAALNTNGTIAKIDPATMTVLLTYPLGGVSSGGTVYAVDMATVAGQPNTLVVSFTPRSGYSPNGMAAYDDGLKRAGGSVLGQFGTGAFGGSCIVLHLQQQELRFRFSAVCAWSRRVE
ncbi:MAG: type sorting protein [Verrucomicrobiaceae bacterium]|nr:type sorting protein [Verrucomicrobiaceae bacterium]